MPGDRYPKVRDVVVEQENPLLYSKDRFWQNNLLKTARKFVCEGDADNKTVYVAVGKAKPIEVMVIVDDSEVATILLYHRGENLFDIYFNQERDKKC